MNPLARMISAIKESFHNDYNQKSQLIKQQTEILHHGIETTAWVMDMHVNVKHVGNLVTLNLWIKVNKVEGVASYFNTLTVLSIDRLPSKGELIHIKYLPEKNTVILVL